MPGATNRVPMRHRILTWENSCQVVCSGDPAIIILSDTVFEFLGEESEGSLGNSNENRYGFNDSEDEDDQKEQPENAEDHKVFWETQNQLLQATLCSTISIESRIRNATKQAIKEAQQEGNNVCMCQRRPFGNGCSNCLMREVSSRLQNSGFNAGICKSKWRNSPDIPSGEHMFLDVVEKSNSKKEEVRVIIELNFRAEFEMARASEEYKQLISRLPQIFVGKVERLLSLIKILCLAAKKSAKETKMHMAPWRKHRYMQAKWLRNCERTTSTSTRPLLTQEQTTSNTSSSRPTKPRASMLTMGMLESIPNCHLTIVEVA